MQRNRTLATLLLLLACVISGFAQTTDTAAQKADRVFGYLLQNQTDSLYACMPPSIRKLLAKEQLEGALSQVERAFGTFQGYGAWEAHQSDSLLVMTSVVSFEHGQLSAVLGFDADWRLHGIRLMPPPAPSADEVLLPADAVAVDDTVRTGAVALPCVVTLSGRSAAPPIVVMVHGSGPLDRDETVMSNKPFRDLALQLSERGISTLRYDKRTFASQAPVSSMDDEVILDALSAVSLARTYSNKVFLLGHSLGAMLASVIASRTAVDGIIMLAAPARDLADVVKEQVDYLSPPSASAEEKRQAVAALRSRSPHYFEPQGQLSAAKDLKLPMLLLQGERDYQVTMTDFRLWQQTLAGCANAQLRSFPSLNHLFLPGEGKSTPQEYFQKGTIPSGVVDEIAHFIDSLVL